MHNCWKKKQICRIQEEYQQQGRLPAAAHGRCCAAQCPGGWGRDAPSITLQPARSSLLLTDYGAEIIYRGLQNDTLPIWQGRSLALGQRAARCSPLPPTSGPGRGGTTGSSLPCKALKTQQKAELSEAELKMESPLSSPRRYFYLRSQLRDGAAVSKAGASARA